MAAPTSPHVSTLTAILVDDENHSIRTLEYELERHCPEVQILDCCSSGKLAVKSVLENRPELLFLDIEMPGMNGFDVLRNLMPIDFEVVFVTAYDQYAIQAFRFAAVDYLLKPIIAVDLKEAVKRVREKRREQISPQHIDLLLHNLKKGYNVPKIALPQGNAFDYVEVSEIIRCQAESNYCHVYLRGGKHYLLTRTLRDLEEWLNPYHFFRCHQSHVINLGEVKRFVKSDGGYLILSNGSHVPVSRRRVDLFNARMKA
ncbi:MAG: response regulator transcription factor [Saprospiraceae bacterium]|nr:response regulator transcription factor [Saprospiraceae bacterium]